jgi:hypothetical protein
MMSRFAKKQVEFRVAGLSKEIVHRQSYSCGARNQASMQEHFLFNRSTSRIRINGGA